MPELTYPPKAGPGDRVAVLSPSWAGPAAYPAVHELGLRRLRDELGLEPVEYPTTRQLGASPQERARDINAAFADPGIRAVLASIGGSDQLTVLRHLDADVIRADPKPFAGYSDNSNLLAYLWDLGIVGYHGGSTMVHLGRGGRMHPAHADSLRAALLGGGEHEVPQLTASTDRGGDWGDPQTLVTEPPLAPAPPWSWHGPSAVVSGPSWGGCLEIVDLQLRASRWIRPVEDYAGGVLLLETSEEMPSATYVERVLMGMGERGLLEQFAAVLVGRPKTWSLDDQRTPEEGSTYAEQQREVMLRMIGRYNPSAVTVLGLDIGHTDPQVVVPYGGTFMVDAVARRITAVY